MSNWYRYSLVVQHRGLAREVEAGRARDFARGVGMAAIPLLPALFMDGRGSSPADAAPPPTPYHVTAPRAGAPRADAPAQPASRAVPTPTAPSVVAPEASATSAETPSRPAAPRADRPAPATQGEGYDWRKLRDELIDEEDFRTVWYNDSKRKPTLGVGHLILDRDPVLAKVLGEDWKRRVWGRSPLTPGEVEAILRLDVAKAIAEARRNAAAKGVAFDRLPPEVQRVLIKMCFQIGSLTGFQKMMSALSRGDHAGMVEQMLDSKWANEDSPGRAHRSAKQVADAFGVPFQLPKEHRRVPRKPIPFPGDAAPSR